MNHQVKMQPQSAMDPGSWLAALIAQCHGHVIPTQFAAALRQKLARVPFASLLTALDGIAANPDRRLTVQIYTAWLKASTDPAQPYFAAWFNLGTELVRAGDPVAGIEAYRRALALRPDFHAAAVNLGLQLEAAGDGAEALDVWSQGLQTSDARTALLNQRARLMEKSGRLAEAEAELTLSLSTNPVQPDAIQHWVHIRQKMCRWPVLAPFPGLTMAGLLQDCGPMGSLALSDDIPTQTAISTLWLDRKTTSPTERIAPAAGYNHRRIRVGYLSSDFGRHAMGYLIAELFERHDRSRFAIYGYCIGQDDGSDLRARIVRGFDTFTMLAGKPDEAAARIIAGDEIDILVDLNGLTSGARPQILRWRAAPVQATYLGFIGSVPLPELDYLFCDSFVIPAEAAASYSPKPLAIAGLFQANDRHRVIGPATTREAVGLPPDAFVFCCFANHYKVTQAMFGAWMAILGQVPGSVLWLAADNEWSAANMVMEAATLGIDSARIIVAPRVDPADYIARMPLADLFLDTFPYNAGTVASDALRMELPLLTLCGRSFVARMAARLLTAIGAPDGITDTLAAYIERAVLLATDPGFYAAYRARFTLQAWQATIGDTAGFTAEYEDTLERVALRSGP